MTPSGMVFTDNSQILSKLNVEIGKLADDVAGLKGTLAGLGQAFQKALGGAGTGIAGKLGQKKPGAPAGMVGTLAQKLAFISVLHDAITKAAEHPSFNVETAINDLWVKLDPVRRMAQSLPGAGPSIDVETQKLKRMIDKRAQLFDTLKGIMEKYDQSAKGIIQSMGR